MRDTIFKVVLFVIATTTGRISDGFDGWQSLLISFIGCLIFMMTLDYAFRMDKYKD